MMRYRWSNDFTESKGPTRFRSVMNFFVLAWVGAGGAIAFRSSLPFSRCRDLE